jgi:YggT family protein
MSWIPYKTGILADIDDILGRICDPYLDLFKKIIPPIGGMIDISPILAIIVLQLIMRVLYIVI